MAASQGRRSELKVGGAGLVADGESDDQGRQVVAGWVLETRLGSGGFAEVWRARKPDTGLVRALKLVRPVDPGQHEDGLKDWRREVQRLEDLSNPHILRFYDAGKIHDGIYRGHAWLTTELCDQSLADILRRRAPGSGEAQDNSRLWTLPLGIDRLSTQLVDELLAQMLAALAAAHDNGIAHRDVKPANVLQHSNGTWKLGDFGIARLIDPTLSDTGTRTTGTTPYMSRAALDGKQDYAADLYALGVTIHEALTGHYLHPWPEDMTPARFIAQVLNTEPTLSSDLPDRWQAIISRLITAPNSTTFATEFRQYLASAEHATAKDLPRPAANPDDEPGDGRRGGDSNGARPARAQPANPAYYPTRDQHAERTRQQTGVAHTLPSGMSVACSSLATGHLEVFALGGDGVIRHRWWWDESGWSDWHRVPGLPRGTATCIAADSRQDGHEKLVVGCDDGSVFSRWYTLRKGEWSDWHEERGLSLHSFPRSRDDLTGPVTSIACVSTTTSRQHRQQTFALDGDGVIRHRSSWASGSRARAGGHWMEVPGTPRGATCIAADSRQDGHEELVVGCDNGSVFSRWYWPLAENEPLERWLEWSEWSDWHEHEEQDLHYPISALACASSTTGHLDVLAIVDGHAARGSWESDEWLSLRSPAEPLVAITASSRHDGHEVQIALAADGSVVNRWKVRDGERRVWSDWNWLHTGSEAW